MFVEPLAQLGVLLHQIQRFLELRIVGVRSAGAIQEQDFFGALAIHVPPSSLVGRSLVRRGSNADEAGRCRARYAISRCRWGPPGFPQFPYRNNPQGKKASVAPGTSRRVLTVLAGQRWSPIGKLSPVI